jgi:hypothetical protein
MSWSLAWSVALSAERSIPCVHQPQRPNLHLTNSSKVSVK